MAGSGRVTPRGDPAAVSHRKLSRHPPESSMPSTSWSLLAAAGEDDGAAALAELVRRYYEPVLAYLSALARDPDRGADMAQSFFADRVLSRELLKNVDANRGSFRCYLRRSVRNFFLDWMRRETSAKRGGGKISSASDSRIAAQVTDPATESQPEAAFHVAWVRALLNEAIGRVQKICAERGQQEHFEIFVERYLSPLEPIPSWDELGRRRGLDDKVARGRAETVARHLRVVLRGMLQVDLGDAGGVNQELALLRALLER